MARKPTRRLTAARKPTYPVAKVETFTTITFEVDCGDTLRARIDGDKVIIEKEYDGGAEWTEEATFHIGTFRSVCEEALKLLP